MNLEDEDNERPGLIQAIANADPDDDMPTLIFADWLEEQGATQHAEWVRVQTALARITPNDPEFAGLRKSDTRLKSLNRQDPVEDLPDLDGILWGGYERGLVRSVLAASVAHYLAAAPLIHRVAPIERIRFLELSPTSWQTLCDSPWMAKVRGLDLAEHHMDDSMLLRLRMSPHIRMLLTLDLRNNMISDTGLEILCDAPKLAKLRTLILRGNQVGNRGVAKLATKSYLVHLCHLDLSAQPGIQHQAFEALADCRDLPKLRRLILSETFPQTRGLDALSHGTLIRQLDCLEIRLVRAAPRAFAALRTAMGNRLVT